MGQFHQRSTHSFYVHMLHAQLFCANALHLYFTGTRLLAQKLRVERWWNLPLDGKSQKSFHWQEKLLNGMKWCFCQSFESDWVKFHTKKGRSKDFENQMNFKNVAIFSILAFVACFTLKQVVSNQILYVAINVATKTLLSPLCVVNCKFERNSVYLSFMSNCLSPHLNLLSTHMANGDKIGQHSFRATLPHPV
jgi:hypothetical protein